MPADLDNDGGKIRGHFLPQIQLQLCRSGTLPDLPDKRTRMIGRGVARAIDVIVDQIHERSGKMRFHDVERWLLNQLATDVFSFQFYHRRSLPDRPTLAGESETQLATRDTSLIGSRQDACQRHR